VVEFWDVVKGDKDEITESLVLSVPRSKFDVISSFDVRRYLVEEKPVVNPAGFPMVKLGDVCKVSFGERITQKKHIGTKYPVYGSGGETFKTDNFNRTGKTCKIGRFAISETSMVMIVDGSYWLMDSGFTVESKMPETITTEFLWYCLLMDKKKLTTLSTGSCQKNIDMDAFYKIEYPCPPLTIQKEIVKCIDAVYSEFGTSITLTQNAWNIIIAFPKMETYHNLFEACKLLKSAETLMSSIGGSVHSKFSL
jgi:hypothetical protein